MIVEQRTYDIVPGKISHYMKMYAELGAMVQRRYLGPVLGYYFSDIGALNQVVHLWAYDDYADRQRRRAALFADPDWVRYFDQITALILRQESTILISASFLRPVAAEWLGPELPAMGGPFNM